MLVDEDDWADKTEVGGLFQEAKHTNMSTLSAVLSLTLLSMDRGRIHSCCTACGQ